MHVISYAGIICVKKFAVCMIRVLWYVFKGFFSMIGCLLNISERVEVVEQFPGVFVLVLLLHTISFGSSISIPWKHQLHMDKPTCSWLNLDVFLLSWILPPGRILIKHFGKKAPAGPWKVTFSSGLCAQMCGTLSSAWKHWKKKQKLLIFQGSGCKSLLIFFYLQFLQNWLLWKDVWQYAQPCVFAGSAEVKNLK